MAVPLVVVWLTSQVLYFKLHTVIALISSIALSFLCAGVVARIWERRSKATEISFSELMIWSWYRLQRAERRIERNLRSAATAVGRAEQLEVLHGLAEALEAKDPYTRGHSRRVERHSFKTGVAMSLAVVDLEMLRMSAALHDVGKIRIPNTVVHKEGALTDEEWALIKAHPVIGASIVAIIGDDQIVAAVRHHHERWDGKGYPEGLAGSQIPLFSRVIAVADTYDAIRSNRSYRTGASRDEAVLVLTNEAGHQLDAEVVEAFLSTLPARGSAVAALSSLATGPAALWRYLAQLFQRFGSTALAPVLGAGGAAVIVGVSSLLTPGLPAVSAMDQATGATPPTTSNLSAGGGAVGMRDRDRILARERAEALLVAAQARADRRTAERRERRADERRERRIARRQEEAAGPIAAATGPIDPPSGATQDPRAVDSPTAPDEGATAQGTDGDPNPEGKDCAQGRQPSKGRRLHCG